MFVPGELAPITAAGYSASDWVASLIEEAATFPNGRYDDQVDAFSQAMIWAQEKTEKIPMRVYLSRRRLPENLYARGLAGPINPVYSTALDRFTVWR